MKWAKYQPKDGDLILVCDHRNQKTYHWFILNFCDGQPIPMEFKRPDGSCGTAMWACICDGCIRSNPNPEVHITGERIWTGDEPFIPDMAN